MNNFLSKFFVHQIILKILKFETFLKKIIKKLVKIVKKIKILI